jgi:phasin family protein
MFTPPQNAISDAIKSMFDMQIDVVSKLGVSSLEGLANLANLNVHAMHTSFNDSVERMHAMLSSKSSLEFFSRAAAQSQPSAAKFISYGNEWIEITSAMRDEFFKATQIEVSEASKEMTSIIEHMVEHETDSFKNMIQLTKANVRETESAAEVTAHAAESPMKVSKASSSRNGAHHHVAHQKKNAASSKRSSTQRKPVHH